MPRVGKHHAAIGLNRRTADLDGLFHRRVQVKRSFEVFEYIANRYRLSSCHHPTRADNDRQPFCQAANDFERRTACEKRHPARRGRSCRALTGRRDADDADTLLDCKEKGAGHLAEVPISGIAAGRNSILPCFYRGGPGETRHRTDRVGDQQKGKYCHRVRQGQRKSRRRRPYGNLPGGDGPEFVVAHGVRGDFRGGCR